jgi:hypothetical protein
VLERGQRGSCEALNAKHTIMAGVGQNGCMNSLQAPKKCQLECMSRKSMQRIEDSSYDGGFLLESRTRLPHHEEGNLAPPSDEIKAKTFRT